MYIEQLYTNCLAEAAYYIESDGHAAVIDPLRETTPYLKLASERNATIRFVFETHFHADFVSGHIDLARQAGALIIFGPEAKTAYNIYQASDGEEFRLGKIRIRVLHTPGHTPESCCYLLFDENGKEHALFTGDTLFVGDVGRPDLLDGVMTREELASMMYDSLNNKIKTLPDDIIIFPAHGPGSACGKNIGKETHSTLGIQKKTNYALQEIGREEFIAQVTGGILPPPAYFFRDAAINKNGYEPLESLVKKNTRALSLAEFTVAVEKNGALVLDTRKADDFEKGFIPGSVNIGLNGQFAVWAGTLLEIGRPIVLITDPGKEEETVVRLARVGHENIVGFLSGGAAAWQSTLAEVESISAEEFKTRYCDHDYQIIDVRKPGEWINGYAAGARLVSLSEFPAALDRLNKVDTYMVYCGGGYRSMIAISLMRRAGFHRLINIYGGFSAIQETGITIEKKTAVPV